MRKRIVKFFDGCHYTDEHFAQLRGQFNEIGIDPIFINERIEILEPEKKPKHHRLTRKKRCKHYATLEGRRKAIEFKKFNKLMGGEL